MAAHNRTKQRKADAAAAVPAVEPLSLDDLLPTPDAPKPPRRYRPRLYPQTPEVMAEIIERLSAGELMKDICCEERLAADPTFPPAYVVYRWRSEMPDTFGEQYRDAQRSGLDRRAERILDIAGDEARDFEVNASGRITWNGHHVRRAELIINAEKWLMSKLAPDVYGDRVEVKHSGGVSVAASADELAAQLIGLVGADAAALMAPVIDGFAERVPDADADDDPES